MILERKSKKILIIFMMCVGLAIVISPPSYKSTTPQNYEQKVDKITSFQNIEPVAATLQDVTDNGGFSLSGVPWICNEEGTDDPGDDYALILGGYAYLHIEDNVASGSDDDEYMEIYETLLKKYTIPGQDIIYTISASVEYIFTEVDSFDGKLTFQFDNQFKDYSISGSGFDTLWWDVTISSTQGFIDNHETDYLLSIKLVSNSLLANPFQTGSVEVKINSVSVQVDCYDSPVTYPDQVTLVSPASESYCTNTNETFHWDSVTGATSYEIQLDDNSDFSSPSTYNSTTPTKTLNFTSVGDYYWRVRAINTFGLEGPWSAFRLLKVDYIHPNPPNLSSPSDGAHFQDRTPTFSWSSVSDAESYRIQVDGGTSYTTGDTNYTWPSSLSDGTHSWHVLSIDAAGNEGTYSSTDYFTIDSTEPIESTITLLSPVNNASFTDYSDLPTEFETSGESFTGFWYELNEDGIWFPIDPNGTFYVESEGFYSIIIKGLTASGANITSNAGSFFVSIETDPSANPDEDDQTISTFSELGLGAALFMVGALVLIRRKRF